MHLDAEQITKITSCAGLGEASLIEEIDTGFSNDVFTIDNKYILKSWDPKNIHLFRKELWCLNALKDKVPVPKLLCFDTKGEVVGQPYIVMEKMPGIPLINAWQNLKDDIKSQIVREICNHLKTINSLDTSAVPELFNQIPSWQDWIESEFRKNLLRMEESGIYEANTIRKVKIRMDILLPALKEQNMKISYYDVHFGNFLIDNNRISAVIDLERVEWVSIDYSLNWVNRMSYDPEEYIEEPKEKEFEKILPLFEKHYPELFQFDDLEKRLEAYTILSEMRFKLKELELNKDDTIMSDG
ncbi:MAG TPA: aminoglycoside phosphotransferase family protein [Candidatus Dojkabacteria bacterium]|nr:aminoglycoside phosphotransferase family protein [Candidatus Dojkabacteria bacterium]